MNILNVYEQMNGLKKCGTVIQWSIIQFEKEGKSAICDNIVET